MEKVGKEHDDSKTKIPKAKSVSTLRFTMAAYPPSSSDLHQVHSGSEVAVFKVRDETIPNVQALFC